MRLELMMLVSACALSWGCSEVTASNPFDPKAPEAQQATGEVVGAVLAEDGCRIEGASATLRDTSYSAATGEDGRFRVSTIPAGRYTLEVQAPGFRRAVLPTFTIALGERYAAGGIELAFARGALTGQLSLDDCPAEDVTITVVATRLSDGGCGASSQQLAFVTVPGADSGAVCGAQIPYDLGPVQAGAWRLELTADAYVSGTVDVDVVADTPNEAAPVALGINPGQLNGRVRLEAGEICDAGQLSVSLGEQLRPLDCAEDGRFSFSVREGTYALTLNAEGLAAFETTTLPGLTLRAGGVVELGEVALPFATGDVEVVVTADGVEAPSGVFITLSAPVAGLNYAGQSVAGVATLTGVRGGTYTVQAQWPDFLDAAVEGFEVQFDGDTPSATIALQINPAVLIGTIELERAELDAPPRISVDGAPSVAVDADGGFRLEVRAGPHELRIEPPADNATHAALTRRNIIGQAGRELDLGAVSLPFLEGSLEGVLALSDGRSTAGAQVRAVAAGGWVVGPTVVDGEGRWRLEGARVGQYTVTAELSGYAPGREVAVVLRDEIAPVNFTLEVLPGQLSGRVGVADGDPEAALDQAVISIQQTGDVAVVTPADDCDTAPCGTFAFVDVAPGIYTVNISLAGYDRFERSGVLIEPGRETVLDDLRLADNKPPEAPLLSLDSPTFTPLPGFPTSPAVIPAGGVDTLEVFLSVDAVEALADANFDPSAGLGEWQSRTSNEWRTATPDGEGRLRFVLPAASGTVVLQARAVDAAGNIGTEAELLVALDTDGPPGALTIRSPAPPPAANGFRHANCVGEAPSVRCHVNGDSVNLQLSTVAGDEQRFGCYFLAQQPLEDGAEFVDPAGLFEGPLDAFECYPAGTQFITVFPDEGTTTQYCVQAFDQSGQANTPSCIALIQDGAPPAAALDLYPHDVEIRGPQITIKPIFDCERADTSCIDANFAYFEKRQSRPGADFEPTQEIDGFRFDVLRGQSNTFAIRAVDRAGNRGEPVEVILHDTTTRPVVEGAQGLASAVDARGTTVVWARPSGCDAQGESNVCDQELLFVDQRLPDPDPVALGRLGTCGFQCFPNAPDTSEAGRKTLLRLGNNGIIWADFSGEPSNNRHNVWYMPFGADRLPGGDAPTQLSRADARNGVLHVAAGDQLIAYVRYLRDEDVYRIYAHPLTADLEAGDGILVDELYTIDAAARPTSLEVHQRSIIYTAANDNGRGEAWLWSEVTDPRSVHAQIYLPRAQRQLSPRAAVATDQGLVVMAQDGDTQMLVRTVINWFLRTRDNVQGLDCVATPRAGICSACRTSRDPQCIQNGCVAGQCAWARSQVPIPACSPDDFGAGSACGVADPRSLAADGDLVTWVSEERRNALTGYKLVGIALDSQSAGGNPPEVRQLLSGPLPFEGPRPAKDRIVYLDQSSGAPRVYLADTTTQGWLGLTPVETPMSHLKAGDGWLSYLGDGLRLRSIDTDVEYPLAPRPGAKPAAMQRHWQRGRGLAMASGLFAFVSEREDSTRLEVLDLSRPDAPRSCEEDAQCAELGPFACQLGICAPVACVDDGGCGDAGNRCDVEAGSCEPWPTLLSVDLEGLFGQGYEASPHFSVATDGFSVIVGSERQEGVWLIPVRAPDPSPVRLDTEAPVRCQAIGIFDQTAACGSLEGDGHLWIYERQGQTWADRQATDASDNWNPLEDAFAENLSMPGLWVAGTRIDRNAADQGPNDQTWIVIALAQSGIERFFRIDRGQNQRWSAPNGLRRLHARSWSDPTQMDATAELGAAAVAGDTLVLADPGLTQQIEIFRSRLSDLSLDRLSDNDAAQVFPAVTSRGIFYIDHRYTRSGAGAWLQPPAITHRTLQGAVR